MTMRDNGHAYICTKLFNYADKIQAEYFENILLKNIGIKTFMPFRDTDENNLFGPDRMRIIYDSDLKMLDSRDVKILVALYDGICKDEGISLEIGYAFGRGIPIFIVNTDFIWYSVAEVPFLFDPIIEYMCADYCHHYEIDKHETFLASLLESQNRAFEIASQKISILLATWTDQRKEWMCALDNSFDVFIDFCGGKYEYQNDFIHDLVVTLSQCGLNVAVSDRNNSKNHNRQHQKGLDDIRRMYNSGVLVFLGDEIELNPGTAALIGLAKSISRKRTILYETSGFEICGENDHRMKKNLMIDFSVDAWASDKKTLIDIILSESKKICSMN